MAILTGCLDVLGDSDVFMLMCEPTTAAAFSGFSRPSHDFVIDVVGRHIAVSRFLRQDRSRSVCCERGVMLVSIKREPVDVAGQTIDQRTRLPGAVELVRAAEQLVNDGVVGLPYTNG